MEQSPRPPLRPISDSGGLAVPLEDLMAAVARGDRDAFDSLFPRIAPAVFGIIRRILRDPAQSEEVAQEVLVEVWRAAARFDPARGSVRAWVMTIAHRKAVDRVRSQQARQDREERAGRRDLGTAYDDVAETVQTRLEQQAVRRCLGMLTNLQRESVTLAYYGGYTYREVAELLGVPLPTVKTRVRDGFIRLRDCLTVTT